MKESYNGINTPLFSIRTQDSCGIGEFLDLKLLIDWIAPLGFNVIQLLPLYASGNDPSPYNTLSANALNPIYISLKKLPGIEVHLDLMKEIEQLSAMNGSLRIEYFKIKVAKEKILQAYCEREQIARSPNCQQFAHENPWVYPYAKFKALKNHFQFTHWKTWPKDPSFPGIERETEWRVAIQWIANEQMSSMKYYAETKGVDLMGDIPILVSPDSADVYNNPDLFDLSLSAGAPPDMYNKEGQNWGFPLYNYSRLEQDNFTFWKGRLHTASKLFHLYRIDHIVGFFRIWAIPEGKKANEGHFVPENPSKWVSQGETFLKMMLKESPMHPIGEDLGVIPDETRRVMNELSIPGTKVIRWERHWNTDHSFIPFDQYPKLSLTTVSTHDSEPLTLWWKNYTEEAEAFAKFKHWSYHETLSREQLFEILKDSYHTPSLFHINLLQEMLALFPELTWQGATEERINLPGVISPLNWTYRYKPSLEEMISHTELNKKLLELIR